MEKKLLCAYCRKLVDYELETRFTIVPMIGERISFAETYGICKICGREILFQRYMIITWKLWTEYIGLQKSERGI